MHFDGEDDQRGLIADKFTMFDNTRYQLTLLLALVTSIVMARVGTVLVDQGDLGPPEQGDVEPFRKAFYGAMLQVLFLPTSFAIGGALALAVYKRSSANRASSGASLLLAETCLLLILLGLVIWTCVSSWNSEFGKASNLFACGVLGCYKADDDAFDGEEIDAYVVNTGMLTFIPSLCSIPYLTTLIIHKLICDWDVLKSAICGRDASFDIHGKNRIGEKQGHLSDTEGVLEARTSRAGEGSIFFDASGRPHMHSVGKGGEMHTSVRSFRALPASPHATFFTKAIKAAILLSSIFILFLSTCWLPPGFEKFTRVGVTQWVESKMQTHANSEKADDEVTFRTSNWKLGTDLWLKVFPDTIIYYGFLFFLAMLGTFAHIFPSRLGSVLQRRFLLLEDRPPAKWWWTWIGAPPWSVSVGGIVVAIAFLVMLGLSLRYWAHDHVYHANDPQNMSSAELTARTLGQVANLFMGLMLFPVSKNSILTSCFGISWEQVIFVHVWMGQILLAIIFAHMVSWWTVYDQQASFPEDILQVPMWFPTNSGCPHSDEKCFKDAQKMKYGQPVKGPTADNYTIQMATIMYWLTLVCTGVFAQNWVRRRNYELFYYLHHVYLGLFVVVLLHASSAWYFLIGGLALWFFDRCLRASKRARLWSLRRLVPLSECETSALQLMPDQGILRDILGLFGSKHAQLQPNFSFQCGQYLYLNIPSISPVEWHPFTISSAPSDGMITCHIKMAPAGRNTFTGKLLSLAEAAGSGAVESKDICVNVDGPYGEWLDPARFDSLLLVAGGIGVTPIHSIFREIRSLMMKNGSSSASLSSTRICQRVHLVWTVQRLSAFEPFVETLKEALADDLGGRLRVSIHCDAQLEPGDTQSYQGLPVFGGRPDVPALVKALATETLPAGLRPHVFVCGPPGLAAAADLACLKNGVSFHKEVFAF